MSLEPSSDCGIGSHHVGLTSRIQVYDSISYDHIMWCVCLFFFFFLYRDLSATKRTLELAMMKLEDEICNTGGPRINELTRFCRLERKSRVGESTESELILSRLDLGGASGAHLILVHTSNSHQSQCSWDIHSFLQMSP